VRRIGSAPPASGAVVMGTGTVSVGLNSDGRHTLSLVLLGIAAAVWVVLGLVLGWRATTE
jgi:tellurite resistance protein TehA-like permease